MKAGLPMGVNRIITTNELGHKLARSVGDKLTLGAYRLGNRIPWVPGALIDVWVPCARGEAVTGVEGPHVFFRQLRGEGTAESGSIHCAACRVELAALRAGGGKASVAPAQVPVVQTSKAEISQPALPF